MKSIFVFVTLLIIQAVSSNLQGPESSLTDDKSKQYERKSAKGIDDDKDTDEAEHQREFKDEFETEVKNFLAKDLNLQSSGIKIVKAPDLSKEGDNKKISETLANLLENQEKWIQKFEEELEEMEKQEVVEEIVVEKTPEEIEGE